MKILLVDDARFMRMMMRNIFSSEGEFTYVEASNGLEAVTEYKIHMPDLVMMDITMPKMDGLEALKIIKVMDPEAKVVMCSAMGQQPYIIEAIKTGAMDYVVKPFKVEEIRRVIRRALEH